MLTAVVAFLLTAAGVALAVVRARRGRRLSATRWFAVALLPAGLYLTGLFPVARTIGGELSDWATKLVLDPRVWAGIALLALSAGLLIGSRWIARRRPVADAAAPARTGASPGRPAVSGAAAEGGRAATRDAPTGRGRPAGKADADLGDFAEIEEILRKRGI
ncbi:hypothetical protein [Kitasatospora sp. NBC_00315]|uniref:hypothetical protein n=1 Tax=Kitasatospora sp. NBC_00315 TaxID=2975963 RepID=UPI0032479D2A